MKIKDYYSILGVSPDADNSTIYDSYQKRITELGEESRKSSSPNYLSRVDVEEAYRMLGASYINKEAYDKEYQQSIALGNLDFEMGEWLEEHVRHEHDLVTNRILTPNAPQTVEISTGKKWGNENSWLHRKSLSYFSFPDIYCKCQKMLQTGS